MKISVVCKSSEWQVTQLLEEARKRDLLLEVTDIHSINDVHKLGDIVIWRSSSLGASPERREVMAEILKDKILINRSLVKYPEVTHKDFQQAHILENEPQVHGIPTFIFQSEKELQQAVQENKLRYPFIEKPKLGSKGIGISLIENESSLPKEEARIQKNTYQNFVRNDGDYRVFVLGGKVLGAIKRKAQSGNFLNNVSQGGTAEVVTDTKVLSVLSLMATRVAGAFDLTLCGVDIIYDQVEKVYRFLEVNTVPQWKGFQTATRVPVAEHIIDLCLDLFARKTLSPFELVYKNYVDSQEFLSEKKFHFLSRMYLWTQDSKFLNQLQDIKSSYLGMNDAETIDLFTKYLSQKNHSNPVTKIQKIRQPYFEKYPKLQPYSDILFKKLFAITIFQKDLTPLIEKMVSAKQFQNLQNELLNDTDAIRNLSTPAINYLFLSSWHLGDTDFSEDTLSKLLDVSDINLNNTEDLRLALYLLTHCIIGHSLFYSKSISEKWQQFYQRYLDFFDKIILEKNQLISLDLKFEYLVCSRIASYVPKCKNLILQEADNSLSPDGNFLIDTQNDYRSFKSPRGFASSEHRNVLYLMSLLESPRYPL